VGGLGDLPAGVGCQWVLEGHWEVRRQFGDIDKTANRKVHRALEAGLKPILLVSEVETREIASARRCGLSSHGC
jgi:triosephosphate isomerase